MSTPTPIPLALAQAAAMAAADTILASVGLPTYTALIVQQRAPVKPAALPEGVVSLDAARANRRPAETVGRPL